MAKERENYLLLSSKQMVGILLDHFIKNIERKKGVVDGGGELYTNKKAELVLESVSHARKSFCLALSRLLSTEVFIWKLQTTLAIFFPFRTGPEPQLAKVR